MIFKGSQQAKIPPVLVVIQKAVIRVTDRDLLREPNQKETVLFRRENDHLNPFFRWAKAKTRGMHPEEAYFYIKGILPPSVMGLHALSHWYWTSGYASWLNYPNNRN